MSKWVKYVELFHKVCGLGNRSIPKLPNENLRALRRKLLREEVKEYFDAEDNNDLVEIADGLGDIVYVVIGTCLEYGINIDAVIDEIQRSNMSKSVDGKVLRRGDGKILKPTTYSPPDIKAALAPRKCECGSEPDRHEVKDFDPVWRDGVVVCLDCGGFVRQYDAG